MPSGFPELLQNAVNDKLVKVESLLAILDRRGVAGTTLLRETLAGGFVDERLQRRLELLLARIIARARVPAPVRQHPLVCADGREVFFDSAWPDRRVAVEGEGLRWHGNATQARKTRARARSITASGWSLYAYGWSDVVEAPDDVVSELESLFCEGSPGLSPGNPSQKEAA
jgi:hypothetical protein